MIESTSAPRGESGWSSDDELAARAAELRRWSQWFAGAGLFLILVLAGLGIFLFKQIRKQEEVLAALKMNQAAVAGTPVDTKPLALSLTEQKQPEAKAVPLPPPPIEPQPAPVPPPKTEPAKPPAEPTFGGAERDRHLEAMGKLTGINLYQSYLNIGLMADVVERKLYTKGDVRPWLERVAAQLELIGPTVGPLLKTDDERADFEQCQKVASLLLATTVELKAYWDTNDKARAEKYHKAREAAWMALSELLELSPPPTSN